MGPQHSKTFFLGRASISLPFRPLGAACCLVVGGGSGEGRGGEGGGASDNCFFAKLAELNDAAAAICHSASSATNSATVVVVHTRRQRHSFLPKAQFDDRPFNGRHTTRPSCPEYFRRNLPIFRVLPWQISAKNVPTFENGK